MALNLTPHAMLFSTAAVGLSEAAYLIKQRRLGERPVCPIGGGCDAVLSSKYNRSFIGIHNDVAGMFFYATFAAATALLVVGIGPGLWILRFAEAALVVATLASAFFVWLQWRVIQAWCFWCLMSAATVAFMDIIVLTSALR